MSSRLLTDLDPAFQPVAEKIVAAWACAGLDVLVTCTRRTPEEQAELYAIGRTKPGRIVTMTTPEKAKHVKGLALDFVPLVHGKPMWKFTVGDRYDPWLLAAQVAKAVDPSVRWGGDWKRFKDRPHLEWAA